jgi:hypothetical protein
MPQGDYDKLLLDDFAFAVVALRLRPDDFWSMSRGEYLACVNMWRRLNGQEVVEESKTQESVDSFSKWLSASFGGNTKTVIKNGE